MAMNCVSEPRDGTSTVSAARDKTRFTIHSPTGELVYEEETFWWSSHQLGRAFELITAPNMTYVQLALHAALDLEERLNQVTMDTLQLAQDQAALAAARAAHAPLRAADELEQLTEPRKTLAREQRARFEKCEQERRRLFLLYYPAASRPWGPEPAADSDSASDSERDHYQ